MKSTLGKKGLVSTLVVVLALFLISPAASAGELQLAAAPAVHTSSAELPIMGTLTSKQPFSFVSNFESLTLEGWSGVKGTAPVVVYAPNYSGEPSLLSSASKGPQIDYANRGFVSGQDNVSFQVAIYALGTSVGYFGLASGSLSSPDFVALVGVSAGSVVAGSSLKSLTTIEPVPTGTAYPSGWVYLVANVFKNGSAGWAMQVFVDSTDQVAANLTVPLAGSYTGAMIDTTSKTVYYTDIVVSTTQLAIIIPGYNNMEGYGEGSGLLVKLLPAYDNLTAEMVLNNWSTPQNNILSFQINAMNMTGTARSTCRGFFQLGIDLNQHGYIAPWYVPGINCEAHYRWPSQDGGPGFKGVPTPAGTKLILSIVYEPKISSIFFQIKDASTSQIFSTSIPYYGGPFYSTYTQMEFQPCCAEYPISSYKLQGQLFDMRITTIQGGTPEYLSAHYMVPFTLDAPPTWNLNFYENSTSGYSETSN